jgi:hypothetical protein
MALQTRGKRKKPTIVGFLVMGDEARELFCNYARRYKFGSQTL